MRTDGQTERNGTTETGVKFLAHGFRVTSEETCLIWWVFDNADPSVASVIAPIDWSHAGVEADKLRAADCKYLARDLTGAWSHYSGAGRAFGERPIATVGKYHTIVVQRTGVDV